MRVVAKRLLFRAMGTNDYIAAAVGRIIRDTAEERGLTITELSARSGVHRVSLQRYIAGDREARLSELARIAEALGVDPGDLVDRAVQQARRDASRA